MERLTIKLGSCIVGYKASNKTLAPAELSIGQTREVLQRLCEYEETGLLPDEILELLELKKSRRIIMSDILEELHREARYALNSHSLNLTYQTYGKAEMAYKLKAITWDEFSELNTILVRNGMNNPAAELH